MRFAIIGCGVIAVTHAMALAALPEQELSGKQSGESKSGTKIKGRGR